MPFRIQVEGMQISIFECARVEVGDCRIEGFSLIENTCSKVVISDDLQLPSQACWLIQTVSDAVKGTGQVEGEGCKLCFMFQGARPSGQQCSIVRRRAGLSRLTSRVQKFTRNLGTASVLVHGKKLWSSVMHYSCAYNPAWGL